jgi:IS30 family transposase
VITLEDWALIRRLHVSEKVPKAQIARQLGISRNTVAKAVASAGPPEYSRASAVTSFAAFELQVRQMSNSNWPTPSRTSGAARRVVVSTSAWSHRYVTSVPTP